MEYKLLPEAISSIINSKKDSSATLVKENFRLKEEIFKLETKLEENVTRNKSIDGSSVVIGAAAGLGLGVIINGK